MAEKKRKQKDENIRVKIFIHDRESWECHRLIHLSDLHSVVGGKLIFMSDEKCVIIRCIFDTRYTMQYDSNDSLNFQTGEVAQYSTVKFGINELLLLLNQPEYKVNLSDNSFKQVSNFQTRD